MSFSFVPSANRSVGELAQLFNVGFTGYFDPVNFNAETFADYARAYQLDTARSMLAYGPEGEFAGCSMLGIRGQRGWIGGFGVSPMFRGSGVARKLMEASIAQARQSKLTSLLLEVLIPNEKAYQLYLHTGYEVTRQTVVFGAAYEQVRAALPEGHSIEVEDSEPGLALARFGLPEQDREFPPCWQRETASILGQRGAKAKVGRLPNGEVMLLCYIPAASRRKVAILQIGFEPALPEKAQNLLLGSLLENVVAEFGPPVVAAPAASFSLLNEPENSPLFHLLHRLNFSESWREYEMLLKL